MGCSGVCYSLCSVPVGLVDIERQFTTVGGLLGGQGLYLNILACLGLLAWPLVLGLNTSFLNDLQVSLHPLP